MTRSLSVLVKLGIAMASWNIVAICSWKFSVDLNGDLLLMIIAIPPRKSLYYLYSGTFNLLSNRTTTKLTAGKALWTFLPVNQMMETLLRLANPSKTDWANLNKTEKIVPIFRSKSPSFSHAIAIFVPIYTPSHKDSVFESINLCPILSFLVK